MKYIEHNHQTIEQIYLSVHERTGGCLTEIHLFEIVFFHLIESFNNESFIFYHLIELFETFQLIESINNVILSYFKLLINCQKRTYGFWQLIETF